jgi:uncharacterized membrane protein YgaE (UPF0421/DUF939 family)
VKVRFEYLLALVFFLAIFLGSIYATIELSGISPDIFNGMQGFIGAIIGAAISILGVWYLTRMQIYEEKKIDLARRRLENLYGPLMLLIKSSSLALKAKNINRAGILCDSKYKNRLDRIIEEAYYLADKDFLEDLVQLYDFHMYQHRNDEEFIAKFVDKVERRYKACLREAGM